MRISDLWWRILAPLAFLLLACDPCWDRRSNEEVLRCVQKYPRQNPYQEPLVSSYLATNKVYVSVTTSPKRIGQLKWMLDSLSLSSDSRFVENVFLSLPRRYKDQEAYRIPREIANYPKLQIIWRDKDLGPIMKLVPAAELLQRRGEKNAILVSVDDDIAYFPGVIGLLVKEAVLKDAVVAGMGHQPEFHGYEKDWLEPAAVLPRVNLIEGFSGVAYPVKWIDTERIIQLSQVGKDNYCKTSDDFVISWSLMEKRAPRFRLKTDAFNGRVPYGYGLKQDALHNGSGCLGKECDNASRYQACAKALRKMFDDA